MKFLYVDESGGRDQSDVFVMAGLLIDAYRLRKKTAEFDSLLAPLLEKHPSKPSELKTSRFIAGKGGWSAVPGEERKQFLRDVSALAADCGKIIATAFSFQAFDAARAAGHGHPTGDSYWLAAAAFVSALLQKKVQGKDKGKGLTVFVMDDNKAQMPALSDLLYNSDGWFDPLYQVRNKKKRGPDWTPRKAGDRFDHIVNTAFAIKSEHSSLIQVADAISYIFRRDLELRSAEEAYEGERGFYTELRAILDPKVEKIGQCPPEPALQFYRAAAHPAWKQFAGPK